MYVRSFQPILGNEIGTFESCLKGANMCLNTDLQFMIVISQIIDLICLVFLWLISF